MLRPIPESRTLQAHTKRRSLTSPGASCKRHAYRGNRSCLSKGATRATTKSPREILFRFSSCAKRDQPVERATLMEACAAVAELGYPPRPLTQTRANTPEAPRRPAVRTLTRKQRRA
ncbi:hypothetical protein MRX96_015246 [Rhipicephalus microplus]